MEPNPLTELAIDLLIRGDFVLGVAMMAGIIFAVAVWQAMNWWQGVKE